MLACSDDGSQPDQLQIVPNLFHPPGPFPYLFKVPFRESAPPHRQSAVPDKAWPRKRKY